MNRHLARLDEVHNQFLERYAAELKYLAIDIAEKWILQRIQTNDEILEQMVMQAVNTVKDCKWMDVQLSEEMVALSERIQQQLTSPEYGGRAQVSMQKTPAGSCVIQTDAGELDVSVSTQAQQLKKMFQETLDEKEVPAMGSKQDIFSLEACREVLAQQECWVRKGKISKIVGNDH